MARDWFSCRKRPCLIFSAYTPARTLNCHSCLTADLEMVQKSPHICSTFLTPFKRTLFRLKPVQRVASSRLHTFNICRILCAESPITLQQPHRMLLENYNSCYRMCSNTTHTGDYRMTGKRTKEQQLQVGKDWNEAKAKGVKIEDFCAEAGRPGAISVANYERAYRKSLKSTTTAPTPSIAVGRSFEKEFEAQFEADRKAAYLKFLEDKADALETELSLVKAEIAKLIPAPTPTPSNATPDARYEQIKDAVLEVVTKP